MKNTIKIKIKTKKHVQSEKLTSQFNTNKVKIK